MRHRLRVLVGLLMLVALLVPVPAAASGAAYYPDVIALPNGWLPEGIVTGHGPVIYSGSRANGAIYAADLRTGEGEILVPGVTGRVAVGLSFDPRTNYIYVAGGPTGKAYIYDADDGSQVREYSLTTAPTFVNDVIVTFDAAYFTDSQKAVCYRVPLRPNGRPAAPDAFETIPLSGDFQQVSGFNSNGIEATLIGKHLIIVNSSAGVLYRVEAETGVATLIDLGGASVSAGDGLLLQGRTLYVVRNSLNQIAVIRLSLDLSRGTLVETITNPNFDVPTTIAAHGLLLYAVNARFGTPSPTTATYTIVRVPRR